MNTQKRVQTLVASAMLSALAYLLMLLEFPLLPAVPYLKMDFGDLPALFAGAVFGPWQGVLVQLLKNLLELLTKGVGTQMGFGNLMNFLVGCAYVLPFSLAFRWLSRRPLAARLTIGIAAGTVSMLIVGFFANWVIAPLFFRFFMGNPLGTGEALAAATISLPFNALKCLLLGIGISALLLTTWNPLRKLFIEH